MVEFNAFNSIVENEDGFDFDLNNKKHLAPSSGSSSRDTMSFLPVTRGDR